MGPGGDMMFAVLIQGFNLNGGGIFPKMFDVYLNQVTYSNGLPVNATPIVM